MKSIQYFIFGDEPKEEKEEYHQMRYRFLLVLVFFGIISSSLFLIGNASGANPLPKLDVIAIGVHWVVAMLTLLSLRLRPTWFIPVAVVYELVCIYVFVAALIWVPTDELRILWFYLNIPIVYLVLGRIAGVIVTIATMAIVGIANHYSVSPYSSQAIATGAAASLYLSGFFYFFF